MRFAVALAMLSFIAPAATTPPKVVFIGDYFTYSRSATIHYTRRTGVYFHSWVVTVQ